MDLKGWTRATAEQVRLRIADKEKRPWHGAGDDEVTAVSRAHPPASAGTHVVSASRLPGDAEAEDAPHPVLLADDGTLQHAIGGVEQVARVHPARELPAQREAE